MDSLLNRDRKRTTPGRAKVSFGKQGRVSSRKRRRKNACYAVGLHYIGVSETPIEATGLGAHTGAIAQNVGS